MAEEEESLVSTLEQRYDQILTAYGASLKRVASSYEADLSCREDLFQDICLAIWQALPRFRGEASERTFVFRIAHNRGISNRFRKRPVTTELAAAAEVADPSPDPEATVEAARRRQRLAAAVHGLPLKLRQVVALSLEGLTHAEIGEVLGIMENNVAVRLNRGRKALRAALDESTGGSR